MGTTSKLGSAWSIRHTGLGIQLIPFLSLIRLTPGNHLPPLGIMSNAAEWHKEGVVLGPCPNMCFTCDLGGLSSGTHVTQMQTMTYDSWLMICDSLSLTCWHMNVYDAYDNHMLRHVHLLMMTVLWLLIHSWFLLMWTDIWYDYYMQIHCAVDHDQLQYLSELREDLHRPALWSALDSMYV